MSESSSQRPDTIENLPMVPLRDIVVFPHTMVPFVVGRKPSLLAVESALAGGKRIFLSTQRNAQTDVPTPDEINSVGTIATIVQHLKNPNGNVKLLVEGIGRARLLELEENEDGFFRVVVKRLDRDAVADDETKELMSETSTMFERFIKYSPGLPYETMLSTVRIQEPGRLADTIAAHLPINIEQKQALLECISPVERLTEIRQLLEGEVDKLRVDKKINSRLKTQMETAQKEYYLNEKIKAIQEELGHKDHRINEVEELRTKIKTSRMSKDAREKAELELKRLEVMPPVSAEATVSRNYLEWLLAVPWSQRSREQKDVIKAETILDEDHFGLDKIKERILEFLAVRQLVKKPQASILCLVGPPGVGKTSLARSVARATGRKFVRMSLGGVRDEAEIRGHRRTYIGAFPGQVIQMMRKAGKRNPVFLLDELDKMAADFRGDPSAALLEVLDPEQNHSFSDHYLDVEYDLSDVMFIATANVTHTIPPALKDRMEVLRIPGYTMREKLAIAQNYLVRKQIERNGIKDCKVTFTDDGIVEIIEHFTREAGVRSLEREIASVCRKLARKRVAGTLHLPVEITPAKVLELLGVPRFHRMQEELHEPEVGVATGLAWTQVGGEILPIEATKMRGLGQLILTGKLVEVMRESAQAALSHLRANAVKFGLEEGFHRKFDVHIHVPEGAIPKDGPSAGIAIATALASLFTGIPVRRDVAMTGEITLRGHVLPIGGLKEKALAAYRLGAKTVLLPRANEKDLSEIPDEVTADITFVLVENLEKVLKIALVDPLPVLPPAKGKTAGPIVEKDAPGSSVN